MLNSLAVAEYILPIPAVPLDYEPERHATRPDELRHLAENSAGVAAIRAAVNEQSERFEKLIHALEQSDTTPADLEKAAEFILDREIQAAAVLVPKIEDLERSLARKHPSSHYIRSLRRLGEEAVDAARAWLEIYQSLRIRLLKLASDRRAATGETGSPVLSDADEMERYLRRLAGQ
jgi:hypothetical protein